MSIEGSKLIDGLTSLTLATSATNRLSKRRTERREVAGAKGHEVSEDGRLYRYRHLIMATGAVPVVDLPLDYAGPLMPVHGDGTRKRFLDEVVASAFHGPYPAPHKFVHVIHLDGDWSNCAANNLRWVIDDEWLEIRNLAMSSDWMHPEVKPAGMMLGVAKGIDTCFPHAPYHGAKFPRYSGMDEGRVAHLPKHLPARNRMSEPPPKRVAEWNGLYGPYGQAS